MPNHSSMCLVHANDAAFLADDTQTAAAELCSLRLPRVLALSVYFWEHTICGKASDN